MRLNIFTVNVQMQEQQKNLKINAITVKLYFHTIPANTEVVPMCGVWVNSTNSQFRNGYL